MHLPTRATIAHDFLLPERATFVDVCRERARTQPHARVFTFLDEEGDQAVTYAELDAGARAVAALLQRHLAPGERALLLYPPGREYVLGFLGCLYAGVVAVPAYPPDPARLGRTLPRLQALVADCGATVALTTSALAELVEPLTEGAPDLRRLRWLATDAVPAAEAEVWRAPDITGEAVAFLQYTSGSTGAPRGVVLRHRQLLHNSGLIARAFDAPPNPVGVIWLPPYHDMGLIGGILQPLFRDISTVLMSPLYFLQRPLRWLEAVSRYGGSVSGGPDFAFELCVRKTTPEERAALDLRRWEVAFCGAEPVRTATLERFAEAFAPAGFRREAFYPCYGLAEGTLIVTGGLRAAAPVARGFDREALGRNEARAPGEGAGVTLVGCGQALGGQELRVVDPDTRRPCEPGRVGEVWLRGPSVADGYWQRPEDTARTFQARLAGTDEGPFLRTGDLGVLEDGELFVTGRLKDVIILRGRNHYPQDLERTVEGCDAGLRPGCGAAFSVEVGGEERLVIVHEVAARTVEAGGVDSLLARVRRELSEQHALVPAAVVLIASGSLPKTSSGKVQRRACREAFLAGGLEVVRAWREGGDDAGSASDVGPADGAETRPGADGELAWMAARVARVLGVAARGLDVEAPLTTYGLDSLRALEVQHVLEAELRVTLPPTFLLQGPSLREVAEWVSRARGATGSPSPLPPEEGRGEGSHQGAPTPAPDAPAPVSDGQRALWFLQRMAPGSTAYHVARAVRFTSALEAPALVRAFDALVARHSALRTAFPEVNGGPVARPSVLLPTLELEDAHGWLEEALCARLDAEAHRPFDLEQGPLARFRLFTGAAGGPVLLIVLHHLVTDFWSLEVLAEELGVLYAAEARGGAASLPPPPPSPEDWLRARDARLAGSEGESLVHWWRERLGGALPVLELPTSRPRPRLQSFRGATVSFRVAPETAARLKALARQHDATPFVALLAGYFAFLRRYTGQDDVVVGTPTAGRPRADLARQVGYFVNPVALRAHLPSSLTFSELIARVRGTVLEALEHQELPFARLVEQLQPRRDPSRAPVFQAMFVLQSARPGREPLAAFALGAAGARARLGDLELESVPLGHRAAAFDVALMMAEVDGGFSACLEYCADLFDADVAGRMARHLGALLDAAAAEPEAPLGALHLLDAEERRTLLEWSHGAPPAQVPKADVENVHALFEAWVARTPDAVALVSGGKRWTYAELDAWASRVALRLRKHGVEPESRVGVMLERGPEGTVAFLAVLKAGGAVVPLDPAYPPDRLAWMLTDSGARVLLTQPRLASRIPVPEGTQVLPWDDDGSPNTPLPPGEGRGEGARHADSAAHANATPDTAAYVIYTSGSTGRPKGVVIPHRGAILLARSVPAALPMTVRSRVLAFASPSFDASVWELLMALTQGAALHVPSAGEVLAGESLHRLLRDERITAVTLPPSVLALLPEAPLPDLTVLISGGEPCAEDLVARFAPGRAFFNVYGPTEITVCATWERCDPSQEGPPSIGRPFPHARAHVVDASLQLVPMGVSGELCIGGASVARGYLGRPELTAERFVPDPFSSEPGARLYRTGDVVRWRPDGRLDFLGRVDAQVKLRGFRIEPGEVEVALREVAGLRQAHVLVWRPPSGGEPRLVAYAVPAPGEVPPLGEVRAKLRTRLPEHLVPQDLVLLDALPLTPSGKVDRRALPPPSRPTAPEGGPRSPLEETVSRAWAEALGLPEVGVHAHFFDDLGGSSLTAVRASSRLREALGRDVPITHLFEHPTVHALARRLSAEAEARGTAQPAAPSKHQERAEARRQVLQRRGGKGTRGNG